MAAPAVERADFEIPAPAQTATALSAKSRILAAEAALAGRAEPARLRDPSGAEDPAPVLPLAKHRPPSASKEDYVAWMLVKTREIQAQLEKKWNRSRELLARGEVKNAAVLEAFLYAPREFFARAYNAKKAYDDTAIPIGHGQTISGPHMVSHMTDSIAPLPADRILEIGTGSGYQSAVLSELSDEVYTIEIVPGLYSETDAIYRKLVKDYPEYANIRRKNGDGYYGWPEHAPFQKIIVTAGIDHIPPPLLAQLAPAGVMVIPVGPPSGQTVLKIVKRPLPGGGFSFERSDIYHGRKVIFVPFTSTKGKAHSLDDSSGKGQ
jgi:protein-L-isoaspartate(D-aspartate) O-methyltransferase